MVQSSLGAELPANALVAAVVAETESFWNDMLDQFRHWGNRESLYLVKIRIPRDRPTSAQQNDFAGAGLTNSIDANIVLCANQFT